MIIGADLFLILSFVITCGLIYKFVIPKVKNKLGEEIGRITKDHIEKQNYITTLKNEVDCLNKSIQKAQLENTRKKKKQDTEIDELKRAHEEKIKMNITQEQMRQDKRYNRLQDMLEANVKNYMVSSLLKSVKNNATKEVSDTATQNQHICNAVTLLRNCNIK